MFTSELFRSGSGDLVARRAYILHALKGPPMFLVQTLPTYITLASINTTKSHVGIALHSISPLCETFNSSRICRDLTIFRGVLYVICGIWITCLAARRAASQILELGRE